MRQEKRTIGHSPIALWSPRQLLRLGSFQRVPRQLEATGLADVWISEALMCRSTQEYAPTCIHSMSTRELLGVESNRMPRNVDTEGDAGAKEKKVKSEQPDDGKTRKY